MSRVFSRNHRSQQMDTQKRPGANDVLMQRPIKKQRTTLKHYDGSNASPSENEGLVSKWKSMANGVWDLSKETVAQLLGTYFSLLIYFKAEMMVLIGGTNSTLPVYNRQVPANKRVSNGTRRSPTPSKVLRRMQSPRPRKNSSQTSSSSSSVAPPSTISIKFITPADAVAFPAYPERLEFQPPTSPATPLPRHPRRRPMDPPPPPLPRQSTELFPVFPPTPDSRNTSVARSDLSRTSSGKPNTRRRRTHILNDKAWELDTDMRSLA
jgi:hypothetical protein